MKKYIRRICICFLIALFFWFCGVVSDKKTLCEELIRLHIVANSDDWEDQFAKFQVRDAVISSLQGSISEFRDMEQAKQYLEEKLPMIQKTANDTLEKLGYPHEAAVSLCRESFLRKEYDTFSLPAGIYESMRIVIGNGAGENWWCVIYPSFCTGVTAQDVDDIAVEAGFSESLNGAITGKKEYQIRFALLEALGRLENALRGK